MSIMQQPSKAQDRTLGVWFQNIQQGQVKLPRFQRYEAWDKWRITSFLNTIINNLPDRAQLVHQAVTCLAAGDQPSLDSIWAVSHNEVSP